MHVGPPHPGTFNMLDDDDRSGDLCIAEFDHYLEQSRAGLYRCTCRCKACGGYVRVYLERQRAGLERFTTQPPDPVGLLAKAVK